MGRLFWKIFLFTILVQLVATVGIGGAIWLKHARGITQKEQIDQSPPAAFMIEAATSTLQYGGVRGLRNLLENMDQHHQIFAVDDANKELLGRPLNPEVVGEARRIAQSDGRHVVRQVQAQDRRRYLLFLTAMPHDGNGFDANEQPRTGPRDLSNTSLHAFDGRTGFAYPGPPPPPHDEHFLPFIPITSAILCSLLFAALLAWYFSKPINSLRTAFDSVANGNLDVDVGSAMGHRRDELTDLGRDFDSMVKRLRVLLDGQRRLMHDVSHELRSPMARLQVAIGLARQQPEKMETSLARIEQESMRMDRLVEELLTLSKLEAGTQAPVQDEVNLKELMADILDDARFEAEANGRQVDFDGSCSGVIQGDAELLHRAIENVLRNALKHTSADKPIVVTSMLDRRRSEWRLVIRDNGPGVPEKDLKTIFEPFYRCAETMQNDGHGLGLAIAKRIIETHGGNIVASNKVGGGLAVEIVLPNIGLE